MTTPILSITEVAAGQTQKETTINNAVRALEQAGNATLSVSFTANARTVTAAEFTRYAAFVGDDQTAAATLTVPLTERMFLVQNGNVSYEIAVGGATGATVTVPASTMVLIRCDGTDCFGLDAASGSGVAAGSGIAVSGSVISLQTISAGTFLGNSGTAAAVPSAQVVGAALDFTGGTLNLGTIASVNILANPGTATAVPSATPIGSGLAFLSGTLNTGTIAAGTLLGNTGTAAASPTVGVVVGSGLAIASGTLNATGGAFPIGAAGTVQSVGQMTVTGTNAGMAVIPNGTGALMAATPDGTATGGDARGNYAVDWQMERALANQVASGTGAIAIGSKNRSSSTYSIAIGDLNVVTAQSGGGFGHAITISATYAFGLGSAHNISASYAFAGGNTNTVSGQTATAFGEYNTVSGALSVATGSRSNDRGNTNARVHGTTLSGGAGPQWERHYFEVQTSGTAAVRLTTNGSAAGSTNVAALGNNSGGAFTIKFLARSSAGDVLTYTTDPDIGAIWRGASAATTTLGTGAPTFTAGKTTTSPPTLAAAPTVAADTTNGGFNISVTPPASGGLTWTFFAVLELLRY